MEAPLARLRVLELAGIGPGPHACMVLADLGADVVRLDRADAQLDRHDITLRGKRIVRADLKNDDDRDAALELVDRADVLVEGFRPGVSERLGFGPDVCTGRNPGLVYGRITGWGQSGPRSERAGHDINYLSITGILDSVGRADSKPTLPLNLVGDFGGGSMFLVVGILAALIERSRSGRGQVIDAAMVDGASVLAQMQWSLRARGAWLPGRGRNMLDGSHPFYDTYECADGKYMAVGAIEPQFYALLLQGLEIEPTSVSDQWDHDGWPELRRRLEAAFRSRDRAHWVTVFDATDACVTPVLDWDEALLEPHLRGRGTLETVAGVAQAGPAPRFSRSSVEGILPVPEAVMPLAECVGLWRTPE